MTSSEPSLRVQDLVVPSEGTATDRVLLVVPSYNEEANIAAVLAEIASLRPACDVVVVDDGSTDSTSMPISRTSASGWYAETRGGTISRKTAQ